jgi:hypothetical protein
MNKQEAIEKIEKEKSNLNAWEDLTRNRALDDALVIVRRLDEPEKPVIPQFVADWYEGHKNDFEYSLYRLCINFNERKLHEDLHEWFNNDKNKPIEVLVLMHKFGYEVEKEKLYTVEIPNPNSIGGKLVLFKQQSTGRLILDMLNPNINKPKYIHLTEPEIKKDFEWAWQFAKKVKEND